MTIRKKPAPKSASTQNGNLMVRLEPELLIAAKAKAARKDETVSQVVRRALRDYVDFDTYKIV